MSLGFCVGSEEPGRQGNGSAKSGKPAKHPLRRCIKSRAPLLTPIHTHVYTHAFWSWHRSNESMVTEKPKFPCVPWPFSSLKAKLLLVQLWGDGGRQRRLDRLRRASQGGGVRGWEGSKGSQMNEKVEWGKRGRIRYLRPFWVGISCSCAPASASPSHRSPIVHSCKCSHPLSSLQSFPYHSTSLICHITLIFHQLHLRILFNVSFLPPHMCVCIKCPLFLTTFHPFSDAPWTPLFCLDWIPADDGTHKASQMS